LEALAHTPPVPWLQNNEWPICSDDFAVYLGELTREGLGQRWGSEAAGKRALRYPAGCATRVVPRRGGYRRRMDGPRERHGRLCIPV
jgi:hypothetical protein